MTKAQQLEKVNKEILACRICKRNSIGLAVPGEGNPDAKIVFIGEAPGKTESKTGRPFVGRSGKFLRENIRRIGLSEDKIYITSPVKRLPERGTPDDEQIIHGMTHLTKQLEIILPKIIVLMGRVAAQGVLNEKISIQQKHGTMIKRDNKNYFFMYHPAAAIRFYKFRSVFEEDFQKLKKFDTKISR